MINFSDYVIYDENSPTGLIWKINIYTGEAYKTVLAKAGEVAGHVTDKEVKTVSINGVAYYCSYVIYSLCNGPVKEGMVVDHIDGNRLNNLCGNLRAVTQRVNMHNQTKRKNNTSGITGVAKSKNSSGNTYWKAHWISLGGKVCSKYFSIGKYGNDEAFRLACDYRDKMIEELNQQGAGYTERHGKGLS